MNYLHDPEIHRPIASKGKAITVNELRVEVKKIWSNLHYGDALDFSLLRFHLHCNSQFVIWRL